jgi:hypothetical protein
MRKITKPSVMITTVSAKFRNELNSKKCVHESRVSSRSLPSGYLLGLFFELEDGGSMFLWNTGLGGCIPWDSIVSFRLTRVRFTRIRIYTDTQALLSIQTVRVLRILRSLVPDIQGLYTIILNTFYCGMLWYSSIVHIFVLYFVFTFKLLCIQFS